MKKKAYIASPDIHVMEVSLASLMVGSVNATVDDDDPLVWDETPGDASTGLSRRHADVWLDDEEEEL